MTIEQAADRLAIRDLADLYHAAVNTRNWTILPGIFTQDAVWSIGPPIDLRFAGLEAICDGIRASVERQEILVQTSTGIVIDLDGSHAASIKSTLIEFGREKAKEGWCATAFFEDQVVKTDGGWRFSTRTVRLRYIGRYPLSGEVFA
jgi:hypothetical protein